MVRAVIANGGLSREAAACRRTLLRDCTIEESLTGDMLDPAVHHQSATNFLLATGHSLI